MARIILKHTKSKSKIDFKEGRIGDIKHSYCDNKKAREILSWIPSHTFEHGLRKTISYQK